MMTESPMLMVSGETTRTQGKILTSAPQRRNANRDPAVSDILSSRGIRNFLSLSHR